VGITAAWSVRVENSAVMTEGHMNCMKRRPRGQTAVLFTLAIVALVGGTALCTDVLVMCSNWESMQKAADAAALAGANLLPVDPAGAIATAQSYAVQNRLTASEVGTPAVSPDDQEITVNASRSVPYYFGRVLRLKSQLVQVSATASAPQSISKVGGVSGLSSGVYGTSTGEYPLIPIGLDYTTPYNYNQSVTLNQGQVGPGNWGSLALGGVGGANERSNLANGYSGPIAVNDYVATEPGQKVGPVDQGFTDRINSAMSAYPTATFLNHVPSDPRAVVLPMVDWSTAQGRSGVMVNGFAMLWIDSVSGGTIQAHFIQQVVPDSLPNAQATDWGAHGAPFLIK
jgi:Flp pilus assembly protein TadG